MGGIAWLLYRQWRQSATDVVGLISSIEQRQTEQENITVYVPDSLPEVQPIVQDIYDRAQASRRAEKEAEQRKNELIAYLAHDLRTPLTSIIGYLSLLAEQPDMPMEQRARYCGIVLDKAVRLESLIDQFFEISRYNMNGMALKIEQFDLKYLLIQMTDEFSPVVESAGKKIMLHSPDELWIQGDSGKLARVQ
ncbi:MAG: sensor histidine kinase [Oscillospiraceae bacterium]